MATIMYTDGTSKEVQPANGSDFQLKELQAIVDGHIEIVHLKDGRIMVIDEEGKLKDYPRNAQATKLAALPTPDEKRAYVTELEAHGVSVISFDLDEEDYIAGTVLVCENHEVQ